MNLLRTEGLSKTYAGSKQPALHDFSLQVEKGEIVALLGESGCGKTTALRVMAGFERADSGTLHLQQRQLIGPGVFTDPAARGSGIVFQDYALFPHKDRKSTRLNSSHVRISYAVFCLKKKNK